MWGSTALIRSRDLGGTVQAVGGGGWDAGLTAQKAVDVASLWPPESSVGSPCVPARAGTCR